MGLSHDYTIQLRTYRRLKTKLRTVIFVCPATGYDFINAFLVSLRSISIKLI